MICIKKGCLSDNTQEINIGKIVYQYCFDCGKLAFKERYIRVILTVVRIFLDYCHGNNLKHHKDDLDCWCNPTIKSFNGKKDVIIHREAI